MKHAAWVGIACLGLLGLAGWLEKQVACQRFRDLLTWRSAVDSAAGGQQPMGNEAMLWQRGVGGELPEVSSALLQERWQHWLGSFRDGEDEAMQRLAAQGWSLQSWREVLRQGAAELLGLQQAFPQVDHQAAAKAWHEGLAQPLLLPQRWRVQHLFVSRHGPQAAKAREKLREVSARLEGGEPWAVLVREFSEDERSAQRGGDLGWVSAQGLPAALVQALQGLAVGQRAGPLLTPLGWHWVRLLESRQPRVLRFEELCAERVALLDWQHRRQWLGQRLGLSAASQTGGSSRLDGP